MKTKKPTTKKQAKKLPVKKTTPKKPESNPEAIYNGTIKVSLTFEGLTHKPVTYSAEFLQSTLMQGVVKNFVNVNMDGFFIDAEIARKTLGEGKAYPTPFLKIMRY